MSPPAVASRSPGPRPRSGIFGRPTLFFQPDLFSEAIAAVWQQDRFPARVLTPGKGYKVDSFGTMLPDREAVPRTIWQALAASRGRQPGGTLVLSLVAGRVLSRQDPKEIREFAATLSFVGLRVQAPAVIALFVAGVWLVIARGGDFTPPWILIGLGAFAVAFVIGGGYLSRIAIQMARAGDGVQAADLLGRWIIGVRVILIILLVAVLDMVFKPGL